MEKMSYEVRRMRDYYNQSVLANKLQEAEEKIATMSRKSE